MDVVIAFLYEFLNKIIYIKQPHLFATELDKVCKSMKALYELKQALYIWYKTLVEFQKILWFVRLKLGHGIFISKAKQLFIALYVNDLLFFAVDVFRFEDI